MRSPPADSHPYGANAAAMAGMDDHLFADFTTGHAEEGGRNEAGEALEERLQGDGEQGDEGEEKESRFEVDEFLNHS